MAALAPRSKVLLEKLAVAQLVKKSPAFYGTRTFITVFTRVHHWSVLSWMNPIHILTFYFLKIEFNIIFASTPSASFQVFRLK
jgi:hypothetical protein